MITASSGDSTSPINFIALILIVEFPNDVFPVVAMVVPKRTDIAIQRKKINISLFGKSSLSYDHIDKTANMYSLNLFDTYLFLFDMLHQELVFVKCIILGTDPNKYELCIHRLNHFHIEGNEFVDMEMMHMIDHKQ